MRNLLLPYLLLATALITNAQAEYKNSGLGTDINNENNPPYEVATSIEAASTTFINSEDVNFDGITTSNNADDSATESFVALHLNVVGLTTQTSMDAAINIYHDSDFIKAYWGKAENGEFNIHLENFGWYIISLSAPGYFEASDTIWVVNEKRKTIDRDIYLVPIQVGMKVRNNINFGFDKTNLTTECFADLDQEIPFLKSNPNVVLEIAGHTDSDGTKAYNLLLSQRRAQAVVDYLVDHGANRAQLVARGYGETKPIKSNDTKADKANNRRVVFTILTMDFASADMPASSGTIQ